MKDFEFEKQRVSEQINRLKEQIKLNKNYEKSLAHIYCLKSTIKENKQKEVADLINFNHNVITKHLENILKEYQAMYKELEKDNV